MAAFYIDGFNLYHAIDDLRQPHLKWLNLWALASRLIPQKSQQLVRVVWCTAVRTMDAQKMARHREVIKAQKSVGVECLEGHFADEPRSCHDCGSEWLAPVEKQGDVNLAVAQIDDAHEELFKHAYLLSADGDQAATVRLFRRRFPDKTITTVSPPSRSHNRQILALATAKLALRVDRMEWCLFDRAVVVNGAVAAIRPTEYDPPPGWVHPRARP